MNENSEQALLIWQEDNLIRRQWTLSNERIEIGRAAECEISLDSRWISRRHALLEKTAQGYRICDAGSKNGLFVNGRQVSPSLTLKDGDLIQLAPGIELLYIASGATVPLPEKGDVKLAVDPSARKVTIRGKELIPPLSASQFNFLALLASQPGKAFGREQIIKATWGDVDPEGVSDDAIDALVRRLRLRLVELEPESDYITTVRGYGYRLNQK